MNPKALKSLEYYKIIDQLTEKASSQMGKDLCRHLLPSEDVYEIRHMQTQTRDALTRLFQKGNISFGSVKDVRGSLKRLEIGSSLGISELLAIAGLLENTWRSWPSVTFLRILPVSKPTPEMSAEMQEKTLWTACLRVWSH